METEAVTGAVGDTAEATGGEDAQRRSIDAVDRLLDEVEQALARLDDGTYGRCEQCGEPIADERLVELAIARTCGSCAGIDIGTTRPAPVPSAWSVSEPAPRVADDNADDIVDRVDEDAIDNIADGIIGESTDDTIEHSAGDPFDD